MGRRIPCYNSWSCPCRWDFRWHWSVVHPALLVTECSVDHFFSSIAAAAPFTGLHWFPEGHWFKQWTGDDLKALMKVCISLPTIFVIMINTCRSILLQLKGMFLATWSRLFKPFYISVTLLIKMFKIHGLSQLFWMHWNVSTGNAPYLLNVVFRWMDLPYWDNILLSIM